MSLSAKCSASLLMMSYISPQCITWDREKIYIKGVVRFWIRWRFNNLIILHDKKKLIIRLDTEDFDATAKCAIRMIIRVADHSDNEYFDLCVPKLM